MKKQTNVHLVDGEFETDTRLPSQTVAWNPSNYIGYSEEQIKLIKVGFDYGLNLAYVAERKAQSAIKESPILANMENVRAIIARGSEKTIS